MHNITVTGLAPRAEIVIVTPALAKEWLSRNVLNRPIRKYEVAKYARDMKSGNWAMNGEAIKFAADGSLLDGQHRLSAVVLAGVNAEMLVITGLANATQSTMDAGTKRTTGDALSLDGEKNAQALAATIKKIWMWERGDYKFKANYTPTTSECTALLAERPVIHRSVETAMRVRQTFRAMPPSVTGTAHYLFSQIERDEAVWFFARVGDGAELPAGHPILALRARVNNEALDRSVGVPAYQRMAYLIRAWNAMREGRSIQRIQQGPKDAMPMPK